MSNKKLVLAVLALLVLLIPFFSSPFETALAQTPNDPPIVYEVGVGPGVPPGVTDAFRAAYQLAGNSETISLPLGPVHDWEGVWIQDFDWASIIYNNNRGVAYYIQGEYISAYVNAGGPGSFLGMPISNRFTPPEGSLLLDQHTDFTQNQIQLFQGGFIGYDTNDDLGGGYKASRYYPVLQSGKIVVEHYWVDDPSDNHNPPRQIKKARVKIIASKVLPNPPQNDLGMDGIWITASNDVFQGWLPNTGTSPKVLEDLTPEGNFRLRFEAWSKSGLAGYLPCDSYKKQNAGLDNYLYGPIDLSQEGTYHISYTCEGFTGGGFFVDNEPPIIDEPPYSWQNGSGWAVVDVKVSDNVAIDWVKLTVNGAEYPMSQWEGDNQSGAYSVIVPLKLGKNTFSIDASDPSGNLAHKPDGLSNLENYEIWSTMDSLQGDRPWMGYSDDPVNTGIGNFIYSYEDIKVVALGPDPLIKRWYNGFSRYDGPLGMGWTFEYDMHLVVVDNRLFRGVQVRYADGHIANFSGDGSGGFIAPNATYETLRQEGNDYLLTMKDQTVYRFNAEGRLTEIVDKDGNQLIFYYSGDDLTQITDASGRSIGISYADGRIISINIPDYGSLEYAYNNGRLVSATDTEGNTAQYTYNNDGQMIEISSPRGNLFLAEQTYDDQGRVVFQRGGTGFVNEFTYGDDTLTTVIKDAYGNSTTHVYDEDFRLATITDALGHSNTYTYNDDNAVLTFTDKNGNTTTYAYDENGNPLTIIDALGNATTLTYDSINNITSKTDALGNTYVYEYDANGHLVRSADPLGAEILRAYNNNGLLIRSVDALGNTSETSYNEMGLPISYKDALGNVSTIAYDTLGHLLSQTDAEGNTSTYQYNSQGLVESVTDPEGYVTIYKYDNDGNLVEEIDPAGYTKTRTFDKDGRLVAETDWAGNVTTYEYDDLGRKISETDALGNKITYVYDAVGNLISKTDKRGAITKYTYDPYGNLLTETNALGNVTSYRYDALNRLVETSLPCACSSRVETTVYDQLGRVVERIDALGFKTRFEYDALNRETSRTDALGYTAVKTYDLNGNLISEIDAFGNITHHEYDAINQQVKTINRLGYSIIRAYDKSGRLIALTNERGYTTRYVYDGNNRLVQEIDALGNTIAYTYDSCGNRLITTDELGRVTRFEYDANRNQIKVINSRGHATRYKFNALNQQVKSVDALGGVTTYKYDPAGALLAETDPLGYTKQFQYDILGQRVGETDRNGNKTTFRYDPAGNLVRTIDALNGVTTSTYDANGNRLADTNALSFTTKYRYDALHRQVEVIDALNGISRQAYDALGRLVEEIDANDHSTQYAYDAEGQRISTTDALGKTTYYEYDPAGNQIKVTDRNGHSTVRVYDALNRQVQLTNALGYSEVTRFDAAGNKVETVNSRGFSTRVEYDANNNLILKTDALGGKTFYQFDALDRQVAVKDANGHTTQFALDAVGNRLSVTLPESQVSKYSYDGERNLLTYTNAKGYVISYTYDGLNRRISETDPMDYITRTEYDAIGQTIRVIDANNNSIRSAYDALGRLVAVTDALGYVTRYTYDAVGNKVTESDANDNIVTFTYDELNRLVMEKNAMGNTWVYIYDPEGNLIQKQDAIGQIVKSSFDAVNQLVFIDYPPLMTDVTLAYDSNGNLVRMTDGIGVTAVVYDALDREISKTDPYNRTLKNSYDAVGNRLSITYPGGNLVTYVYNANNWLVQMNDPRKGATKYQYDSDKLPIRTDYPNGTWTKQTYDLAGRLIEQFNGTSFNAGVIKSFNYTLDAVGNRLQAIEKYTDGQIRTITTTYQYNVRYEVLEAVEDYQVPSPYNVTTRYTYDGVGNRLTMITDRDTGQGLKRSMVTKQYTYDKANRLLTAGNIKYTYDANGNRLTKFSPGKVTAQDRTEEYTYDAENRLTVYVRIRSQSKQVEQTVYSIFDGLGRRLNKGTQESKGVVKWTQYALDSLGYNQMAEYPQFGTPRISQLYRGQDGQLVSMDETQGGGGGSQYWFATDGLGSMTATTKQDGQSAHEYFYDAYGQLLDANGHWEDSSSWTNPHNHYLLTGKEWDEESRLYYFGARFYDAEAGVWLTQDPYRGNINSPMTLHRYLYVRNNPVNRIDPLGFFDWNTGHVEWGDTLSQIARDAGVSITQIVNWNPQVGNPNKIYAGMYLWLPQNAINAGKLSDAIRHGAGTGETRWGKPGSGSSNNCISSNESICTVNIDLPFGVDNLSFQVNLSTPNMAAIGLSGIIRGSLGIENGYIITGSVGGGIEWNPVEVNSILKKADELLQSLTGYHIVLNASIGVYGNVEYNLCTNRGDLSICVSGEVNAGVEKRLAAEQDWITKKYEAQRFGIEASGQIEACLSLCSGDLTWDASVGWAAYANFGWWWFNRTYEVSGEISSNGPQYITTWEDTAFAKKLGFPCSE